MADEPYFTTAELRSLPDIKGEEDRFPDERLDEAHDWIVGVIEREVGTSFVARAITETLSGSGSNTLFLSAPYVRDASAVTVNGSTVTGAVAQHGILYYPSSGSWPLTPRNNVTVTYEAGYSTAPPPDLKQAALRAARSWLLTMDSWSGKDSRATTVSNEDGTFQLSIAGKDRPTGIPDVDVVIVGWRNKLDVLGFA